MVHGFHGVLGPTEGEAVSLRYAWECFTSLAPAEAHVAFTSLRLFGLSVEAVHGLLEAVEDEAQGGIRGAVQDVGYFLHLVA